MNLKKLIVAGVVVIALAAIAYANIGLNRETGLSVTAETIEPHDLEAIVTASGSVQPKSSVDISAETMGKVVAVHVVEGQIVTRGQPLLEIDATNLDTVVRNRTASLESSRLQLMQTEAQIENARINLQQSKDDLTRDEQLWNAQLIPRTQYERSMNVVKSAETQLEVQLQSANTQRQRIMQAEADLDSAEYDLNKVRATSPIDGIVTRRNIEEGETAVVGTMNNAGTVLLTIADLSVIETELEVDETDIPYIQIGQPAMVTIDAIPDREFTGRVTEVGNSPIQAAGATTGRATNFKVVVTIDGEVPGVRPGFTCTATITTATRTEAVAVPIQAMAVREMVVDAEGDIVRREPAEGPASRVSARRSTPEPDRAAGQELKEIEGAFVVEDGRAVFRPVRIGITGETHFEVLSGLENGDVVITGPFSSVRTLRDGDEVTVTDQDDADSGSSSGVTVSVG